MRGSGRSAKWARSPPLGNGSISDLLSSQPTRGAQSRTPAGLRQVPNNEDAIALVAVVSRNGGPYTRAGSIEATISSALPVRPGLGLRSLQQRLRSGQTTASDRRPRHEAPAAAGAPEPSSRPRGGPPTLLVASDRGQHRSG